MESPAPTIATPQSGSYYHFAASYAVYVVPASIALNMLLGSATAGVAPSVRSAVMLIPGLLFFSAVPAGVIALVGIRKHGVRKLLWKGLFGIVVPIVLFVAAIFAFQMVRESALKMQRQTEKSAK
jgi:predicted membrane protein